MHWRMALAMRLLIKDFVAAEFLLLFSSWSPVLTCSSWGQRGNGGGFGGKVIAHFVRNL